VRAACVDIDAGRFVDLLELDAASARSTTAQILDNALRADRRPLRCIDR
jgi:DNA polymerase III gamma/tau subunit